MKIMQPAYVENKDLKDLYLRFALYFGSRWVDVYVWRSVRGLRRNTYFKQDDHLGAYLYYPYRTRRNLFGEIHLIKRMIGAGYVAHEIQHFALDWLLDHKINGVDSLVAMNEPLAKLTGDVTKDFWRQWLNFEKRRK